MAEGPEGLENSEAANEAGRKASEALSEDSGRLQCEKVENERACPGLGAPGLGTDEPELGGATEEAV